MREECGFIGFFRRALYKLSGQKIISFMVSSGMIYLVVWAGHKWAGQVTEPVLLEAIKSIKTICIALLAIKGGQNIVGMFRGNGNGNENP